MHGFLPSDWRPESSIFHPRAIRKEARHRNALQPGGHVEGTTPLGAVLFLSRLERGLKGAVEPVGLPAGSAWQKCDPGAFAAPGAG